MNVTDSMLFYHILIIFSNKNIKKGD